MCNLRTYCSIINWKEGRNSMSRQGNNKSGKKASKKVRNLIFSIFLLVISVGVSYIYFTEQKFNNVIYPQVKIEGIDFSGKTKEEAIKILRDKYGDAILQKKVNIKALDRNYSISFSQLNAKFSIIETVDEALAYGKESNIISKFKLIKNPNPKEYNLKFTYNQKPLEDLVKSIEKDINKKPQDAAISFAGAKFQVSEDVQGAELDSDKLKQEILSSINGKISGDININAPIKTLKPKVTAASLKQVNTKIASYSTDFSSSSEARSTNIRVATSSINGKVLMPGESFSFNEVVGERTKERGYKEAGVIINQQLDSGLGGGICQVSSTLYNALLGGNIKTTERIHHTFPSSYVGMGLDATVDWGNIDLKFKNTFDYPIYIEGYTQNKVVYFNIYSNSELAKRTYSISTEVYDKIEPTVKYIDDPTMAEGKTEVVKKPSTGYRVKVYRSIFENGKFISKELVSNDYYVPINGITKRGTKK